MVGELLKSIEWECRVGVSKGASHDEYVEGEFRKFVTDEEKGGVERR